LRKSEIGEGPPVSLTHARRCLVTALATRGHIAAPPPADLHVCLAACAPRLLLASVCCRVACLVVPCFPTAATCLLNAVVCLCLHSSGPALCFCATLRSCCHQASIAHRRGAGIFPKLPTTAKSRPKQAEVVHHLPLRRLAVDSTPLILSRSAATSSRWALGLCCSLNRQPSSLTTCAAQHRRPTPARARRRGG
jgi:hypothetical protein